MIGATRLTHMYTQTGSDQQHVSAAISANKQTGTAKWNANETLIGDKDDIKEVQEFGLVTTSTSIKFVM